MLLFSVTSNLATAKSFVFIMGGFPNVQNRTPRRMMAISYSFLVKITHEDLPKITQYNLIEALEVTSKTNLMASKHL